MKRYWNKKAEGYFTIEAALLLPLVIMLIVFMIFLSFYCYDRCILEQCAYAAALRGSSNRFLSNEDAYEEALQAAESLTDRKLYAIKLKNIMVRVSGFTVTVSYECEVNMPIGEWLKDVLGEEIGLLKVSKEVARNRTVAILRQIGQETDEEKNKERSQ